MKWTGWTPGAVPFWLLALATFGITVAFASASYFGVERPALHLKDRIGWWDRESGPFSGFPLPMPSPVRPERQDQEQVRPASPWVGVGTGDPESEQPAGRLIGYPRCRFVQS